MRRPLHAAIVAVALALTLPHAAHAQTPAKPAAKTMDVVEFIKVRLLMLATNGVDDPGTEQPQVAAPAASSSSASLADAPSFASLIGLAIDNDLVALQNGALTVSVTPFSFRALKNPSLVSNALDYSSATNSWLRRIGGSVSAGGKGESFDRDGDGKADAAKTATDLGDIVTAELRYRFFGVRDRNDSRTIKHYLAFNATKEADLAAVMTAAAGQVQAIRSSAWLTQSLSAFRIPCDNTPLSGTCTSTEASAAIVKAMADAHKRGDLASAEAAIVAAIDAHTAALKAIDRSPEWSVVVGMTRQAAEFGPDRVHAGIRGLYPVGRFDHIVNVDWTQATALVAGEEDATSYKGAYQILRTFPTRTSGVSIKFSYTLALERYQHVPDAKHEWVAKTGVKIAIPLTDSMSVPISVNWANHRDLLTDQSVLKGYFGLAWDFSVLEKKKK